MFHLGWAEDKMFPEDFQYELFVNAKAYIRECSRYMVNFCAALILSLTHP